ncbi:hypothetical protein BCR44DRAFT_1432440 [Catenaria anguillulae PL171]|uniref:BTB domain-containing protein n=1 Tax=Catenaria anguillulae PL171 TaxID=765915 RepID=A0A1Y2HP10_9FUNG|nr:hypothetical protein BCR44DRAFT_1432440 [Catenaria anguillulae PL171]
MKRSGTPSQDDGPIPPSKAARTITIASIAASCQDVLQHLSLPLSNLPATATSPSSTVKHGIRTILSHLLKNPTLSEPSRALALNLFRSMPSWRESTMFHFASPPVDVWNSLMSGNQLELFSLDLLSTSQSCQWAEHRFSNNISRCSTKFRTQGDCGLALFRPLFLPFLQVLAPLLPKSANGPSHVRDAGLIPQLTWLFSTLFIDSTTSEPPHLDDIEADDSHFATSSLYLADYDLAVQLARILVHLFTAAPQSAIYLFARRLVDSVLPAPPVIVVRRSSTAPPTEHKRALFSKCLKLLSLLLCKWELTTPIIQHGLVPLVLRLSRYPNEQEVVPDPTEVYLCCLCARHLAESSLLRLRVRDSAELTRLWSLLVGNLTTFTLESGQLAVSPSNSLPSPSTCFQYMSLTPCLPADADLDQHQPLAWLVFSVSHGPTFSRTPDLAVQLLPSLIRVPHYAAPHHGNTVLDMQLVLCSRADWLYRILVAFHTQVVPSKRVNWLSSVVALWIQSQSQQSSSTHIPPQAMHLARIAKLATLHDPRSIVGFALLAEQWLSRPYRDPIPTSDMWTRFAHGCVHQAREIQTVSIACAGGAMVLACRSCLAHASGYFSGLFLDGFLESSATMNPHSGPAGVISMDWLPADLLRDMVDFAFMGKTAGQWWPSEDGDVHGRVQTLVEMVLLADRIVSPTIQLACLELLFACLNPTSRFIVERFPLATPPPVAAPSAVSYPSAWSPFHRDSSTGVGSGRDCFMPSYSPSPPGSPVSLLDEEALPSSTADATAVANEAQVHKADPQVAHRLQFVGQVARAILDAYIAVTMEGWPAECCNVFQPLLMEAAAQLLVRYPVALHCHLAHQDAGDPDASSGHFDTLLLELCNRFVDLVV